MLFPLDLTTPQCKVFKVLNDELLHFLEKSVSAKNFDPTLFTEYQCDGQTIKSACWENPPTKEKFKALWDALPGSIKQRQDLFDLVRGAQDIESYFSDPSKPLPILDDAVLSAFQSLTTHLFTSSKSLKRIEAQASCSIKNHFQEYKQANGNSSLCFICGTERLSQDRHGVAPDEQWRADYDHVLCRDKYPIYSVHPGNFVPTCRTCNSKAKGTKELLCGTSGARRAAFYPLPPAQEACCKYVALSVGFKTVKELSADWRHPMSAVDIFFPSAPLNVKQKINVWEEVYEVPNRVKSVIHSEFIQKICADLMSPNDLGEFLSSLERFVKNVPQDVGHAEWRFWWHSLYVYLDSQDQGYLKNVWSLIEGKQRLSSDSEMFNTFGI